MNLEFLITSAIVILLPGTGVLYTVAIGLGRGFKASVAAALGCTFGIVPAAVASVVGLAAVFHASALAFQIVKYLGVLYLLYMAWRIAADGGALAVNDDRQRLSWLKTAVTGALINILNPKLSLFFLAFLPQFVDLNGAHPTVALFQLSALFMLMTFAIFLLYGGCAALVRDYIIARPRVMAWIRRSFAAAFAVLGLKLALSER